MLEIAIVLCAVVPAVLSWGIVEAIKRAWLSRYKLKHTVDASTARERAWWMPLLVFLAIAIGAVIGLLLGGIGWEPGYGAAVGASSGVLSAVIVKLLKERLGRLADRIPGMPRK